MTIVMDPFGGSGSTLIASEKTDRQARLIELDRYVDVTVQRWQTFTGKQALLESEGCSFEEITGKRCG